MQLETTGAMLALNAINIVYVSWVLSLRADSRRWSLPVAAAMLLWLAALHIGLSTGSMFAPEISGLAFLAVILAAVAGVAALLFLTPLRLLMAALSQQQLMLLQGVRVWFGAVFLMWAAQGLLPPSFGIVDGFTHVGAGFFGLIAAHACASGHAARARTWFATLFGMADILVVAGTLALVLLPQIGVHHPMMYAVFLPAPLWLCAHLASLRRLVRSGEQEGSQVPLAA